MSDKISAAIDALLEELEQQARAMAETKKVINSLRRRMGEEPLFLDEAVEVISSAGIAGGSFYGKPLATAITDVLRRRKSAATTEEILADMKRGEFDFRALGWQEATLVRALASSMAKNTKTFHRLPSGSFGLLEWYPAVKDHKPKDTKPKAKKKAASKAAKSPGSSAKGRRERAPKPIALPEADEASEEVA